MKQVEVQIMGQGYLLGCPEGGEARLQAAVDRVDAAMCKIRDAGKIKARDRIAVLAALNLAFDLTERPAVVSDTPEAQTQLQLLLERLDAALGHDGQLL
jgi:cell division protein ZapA